MPRARTCGLGSSAFELCSILSSEWSSDFAALVSDGRHWRSVFGGARLVGPIRMPPKVFLAFRLLLLGAVAAIFGIDLDHSQEQGYGYYLYFEHWTLILQLSYFVLASLHSFVAIGLSDSTQISRSTPVLVRLTELMYGALLPATMLHFWISFTITWPHPSCTPVVDTTGWQVEGVALAAAMLGVQLLDLIFNRQPYYAFFSALTGLLFCWSYLIFAIVFEYAGGKDPWGHSYVYRCLDWSFPIVGGGVYTTGKLLYINLYIVVPLVNLVFWLLLWVRRRALIAPRSSKGDKALYGGSTYGSATTALLDAPRSATSRRIFFEYGADYRDLTLDGRHWRAQFGGSSGQSPKLGAYVCCGPVAFMLFRILLLLLALTLLVLRFGELQAQFPDAFGYSFLYYDVWVLFLICVYFLLASVLTANAAMRPGAESLRTPCLVWCVWAAYGALLPSALIQAIVYMINVLEINGQTGPTPSGASKQPPEVFNGNSIWFDLTEAIGIFVMVLLDAWVNRQPYYASFHGLIGVFFNYGYFAFLCIYSATGGENAAGDPFVYAHFDLSEGTISTVMQPSQLTYAETFLLIPALATMYWCALWARRRAIMAAKQPGM